MMDAFPFFLSIQFRLNPPPLEGSRLRRIGRDFWGLQFASKGCNVAKKHWWLSKLVITVGNWLVLGVWFFFFCYFWDKLWCNSIRLRLVQDRYVYTSCWWWCFGEWPCSRFEMCSSNDGQKKMCKDRNEYCGHIRWAMVEIYHFHSSHGVCWMEKFKEKQYWEENNL